MERIKLKTMDRVWDHKYRKEMIEEVYIAGPNKDKFSHTAAVDWFLYTFAPQFAWEQLDVENGSNSAGIFRIWDGSCWARVPWGDLEDDFQTLWPGLQKNQREEFWRVLKIKSRDPQLSKVRNNAGLIFCKNVVIKVTKEGVTTTKPSPKYYNKNCLEVNYDPKATCPNWIKFMEDCLGSYDDEFKWHSDDGLRELLQDYIGYTLQTSSQAERLMIVIGTGANGKSVMMEGLTKGLFKGVCGCSSLSRFQDNDNHLADLVGNLLVYHPDESSSGWNKLDNSLKAWVSGEPLLAKKKYERGSYIKLTAKGIFAMNNFPRFADGDNHSLSRRILAIPFNRTFDKASGGRPKDEIVNELVAESAGLLNFAIHGLYHLIANGWEFIVPELMSRCISDYKSEMDTISPWVEGNLKITGVASDYVSNDELRESYTEYCIASEVEKKYRKSPNRLIMSLIERFPQCKKGIKNYKGCDDKTLKKQVVRGCKLT